jgi:serine-type D-Ala-D-Ala carboxypeptidase
MALPLAALVLSGLAMADEHHAHSPARFDPIADVARAGIASGRIPGAVIGIGNAHEMLYRASFGFKTLGQQPTPLTIDTIFDLASLTKVVATTPAIMQLIEQHKLEPSDTVAKYWPEFAANGKNTVTIRDLLTHYSGLAADLDLRREWSGYQTAMAMIVASRPAAPPGERYRYSDINFEVLGELVRRVSGSTLDEYARAHIFAPLAMNDTGFLPPARLLDRIAPTQDLPGRVHWGDVHDATARRMGGVAGHAGLFSDADDLATFARMMLGGGSAGGQRVLSARSVAEMTMRQSPPQGPRGRGYGWDLGGPDGFAAAPRDSYGHLGFTGTMIWIAPDPGLYAIVLTHRVYPDGTGDADPLRRAVLGLLANESSSR